MNDLRSDGTHLDGLRVDGLRFDCRVAVVTGAGRGLGRATALELAARGAAVLVHDATDDESRHAAAETVEMISRLGGTAAAVAADLAAPADAASAIVGAARSQLGPIDILVHNAGVAPSAPVDQVDVDRVRRVLDINVVSVIALTSAAWPDLCASGAGRVVTTTSAIGLWGGPGQIAYAASKAAIVGLTRSLAIEGGPHGVKVNAVAPAAQTRLTESRFAKPSRRWRPELVVPATVYLAHASCGMTGVVMAAFSGLFARVETVQGPGVRFDPRREVTVDQIAARMDEITAMDGAVGWADGHDEALRAPLEIGVTT